MGCSCFVTFSSRAECRAQVSTKRSLSFLIFILGHVIHKKVALHRSIGCKWYTARSPAILRERLSVVCSALYVAHRQLRLHAVVLR